MQTQSQTDKKTCTEKQDKQNNTETKHYLMTRPESSWYAFFKDLAENSCVPLGWRTLRWKSPRGDMGTTAECCTNTHTHTHTHTYTEKHAAKEYWKKKTKKKQMTRLESSGYAFSEDLANSIRLEAWPMRHDGRLITHTRVLFFAAVLTVSAFT